MAHYAMLDENNIVLYVFPGRDEDETVDGISDWEEYYGNIDGKKCVRTSYNTFANEHSADKAPFRGNYAGIGFYYNEQLDAFIPPKPQNDQEWILDETTYQWVELQS